MIPPGFKNPFDLYMAGAVIRPNQRAEESPTKTFTFDRRAINIYFKEEE